MLKRILAIAIGLVVLAFWGFSVFDMIMTLTDNEAYLAEFPQETIAWMQQFPLWRKIVWGSSIGLGLLGGALLLFRSPLAGHAMLAAFVLLVGAFLIYDLGMANGAQMYGQTGLIGSGMLIALALVFTLAAYGLARRPDPSPA